MGKRENNSWLDRAVFDDAVTFADEQWLRDMYDLLSKDGYDEEVVLDLISDLLVEPDMLYRRSIDTNPFLSENDALKVVLDQLADVYQNKMTDAKAKAASLYKMDVLRDRLKLKHDFPFLDVDVMNNGLFTTHLNAADEEKFRNWYSGYSESHGVDPDPDNPERHYDSRGWWKQADDEERFRVVSDPGAHLSDRYKMPGHPTFSDESMYHDPARPETTGGHWNEQGFFRPSEYQRQQPGRYITDAGERTVRQRYTESGFVDNAFNSTSNARGAYQITPVALQDYTRATGRRVDLDNAAHNESVRDWYMQTLPNYMGGDVYYDDEPEWNRLAKIYAAYNWGAGNLNRHLRDMERDGVDIHGSLDWMRGMPKETSDYVNFIVLGKDVNARLNTDKFDSAVNRWSNR